MSANCTKDFQTSIIFDNTNKNWYAYPEHNALFIRAVINHLSQILQIRGHVFLNEVHDSLGVARTRQGQVLGWLYDKDTCTNIRYQAKEDLDSGAIRVTFANCRDILDDFPE